SRCCLTFLTTMGALATRLLYPPPWLPQPAKAGSAASRASRTRLADIILMSQSPRLSLTLSAVCHAGNRRGCYLENMDFGPKAPLAYRCDGSRRGDRCC